MVMTREEKAYELMLEEARAKVRALEGQCPHVLSDGRCEVCKKDFGWECPESPDRVCHYEAWKMEGIQVREWFFKNVYGARHIIDKEKVKEYIRPQPGDTSYYDEDCCIFCGHPYERK